MERVAPREDSFHNQSLNRAKPQFNYINKPSIIRAQLTAKPTSRDLSTSYLKSNNNPLLPAEVNHPGKRAGNAEISIFDAEKYFNGAHEPGPDNNSHHKHGEIYTKSNIRQPEVLSISRSSLSPPKQSISSISRLSSMSEDSYGRNYRPRSSHVTPTVFSEASWNSKTGLLINPPGLAPVSIRNLPSAAGRTGRKTSTASMKWFLRGNKCPCSGKKSVNVQESNSEGEASKTPPRIVQLNRISCGGGGGSLYSSRQSSPKTFQCPLRGLTNSTAAKTRAALIPNEQVTNFIARPQLDQNKIIQTNANPNLDDLHREKTFPPDHVAVTVRTVADGSGTTSNGFTFPILSSPATPPKRMFNIVPTTTVSGESAADAPRDSIDVFQPQDGNASRTFTFPTSPRSRRASYEDEMCSDASSDLFEIESFSATTQSTLFLRRDSLDDPALTFTARRLQSATLNKPDNDADQDEEDPATPTECYAPSEVSVDWSVTTAEGFERVSASDAGYAAQRCGPKSSSGGGIAGDGESKRRGGGGLLTSCRREKAVNVGPDPIKFRQAQRGGM